MENFSIDELSIIRDSLFFLEPWGENCESDLEIVESAILKIEAIIEKMESGKNENR